MTDRELVQQTLLLELCFERNQEIMQMRSNLKQLQELVTKQDQELRELKAEKKEDK
jgi:hypothetical protein